MLSFAAAGGRLHTQIGRLQETFFHVENAGEGQAVFGPYVDLEAGVYVAKIRFCEGRARSGSAIIDVVAGGGARVVVSRELRLEETASDFAEIDFNFTENVSAAEVRLFCRAGAVVSIAGLDIDFAYDTSDERRGGSDIGLPLLQSIQKGTMAYSYRGVPTWKSPFDWALYPLVLWEIRPKTIIEIGSNRGGSALWFADTMRSFELPVHIHSIDVNLVTDVRDPDVTFHRGDAEHLENHITADFMAALPRPLMVIEDSSHMMTTTLAVLNFFHPHLSAGEYIIAEDGIVTDMGRATELGGGPRAAIAAFLDAHDEFVIDTRYCDWFGKNATYAVNGFLRRR